MLLKKVKVKLYVKGFKSGGKEIKYELNDIKGFVYLKICIKFCGIVNIVIVIY